MGKKFIACLVFAVGLVTSDIALARDLTVRNPASRTIRSTPTMKVPRTRATPRNVVPIYPGIDRSTLGLEYNQQLRLQINKIPPYVPIR
jgi:hypothetical protein